MHIQECKYTMSQIETWAEKQLLDVNFGSLYVCIGLPYCIWPLPLSEQFLCLLSTCFNPIVKETKNTVVPRAIMSNKIRMRNEAEACYGEMRVVMSGGSSGASKIFIIPAIVFFLISSWNNRHWTRAWQDRGVRAGGRELISVYKSAIYKWYNVCKRWC